MRLLCALMLLVFWTAATSAEEPKPLKITIHPQAIESPVLKYRLLPEEAELKPGNAVPILLRLPWEQQHWMQKVAPTLYEWSERPLTAPEWETAGSLLPDVFYREMKRAAFRRDAEWEYPIGEQPAFFILLPDAQGLRLFLGHGLAAKIRYHLTRGEVDQAREAILVGLANARHMAQTPFFVNQLVSTAIQKSMLAQTAELISRPNSPNLYWALATLPESLAEIDRAASFEGSLFAITFPAALDLERQRDAQEWKTMAEQLVELLSELGELPKNDKQEKSLLEQFLHRIAPPGPVHGTPLVKLARKELPKLLDLPEEKVAAMTDEEAAVRWYVSVRVARDQKVSAILRLSPREAWPQLEDLQREDDALQDKMGHKLFSLMQPTAIYLSLRSPNRQVQALRAIEAVRHHLATHDGKLPESLDAIKSVPIPRDPITGEPFQWKLESGVATLSTPPLPVSVKPEVAKAHHIEFKIRIN